MNDAELKAQPRSVREQFERINQCEIDHDEPLSSLKTQLIKAKANLCAAQAASDNVRGCIQWFARKIRLLKATVQDAEAVQKGRK